MSFGIIFVTVFLSRRNVNFQTFAFISQTDRLANFSRSGRVSKTAFHISGARTLVSVHASELCEFRIDYSPSVFSYPFPHLSSPSMLFSFFCSLTKHEKPVFLTILLLVSLRYQMKQNTVLTYFTTVSLCFLFPCFSFLPITSSMRYPNHNFFFWSEPYLDPFSCMERKRKERESTGACIDNSNRAIRIRIWFVQESRYE